MKKQILAMVLTLCMVVSMLPAKALAVSDFSDMPNDYSTEALQNAVKNGLLSGSDGKIMANDNLTRAQMAAVLVRAFGADKAADLTAFTDVTPDAWYYTELSSAVYMGIIKGDGATMRPNAPITRQEALVVLARAYGLETENTSNLDQFSDKASIGEWAKSGVAAMIASGFVKGDGANLNPLSNISRKEFAVVMDRMVETYIEESGTVTTLPDGSVVINKPHVTLKGVTVKGNLIIGDGVGDGGVTLDCVNVEGNIVVRGGGAFVVKGNSSLGKVIISKVDGNVRVAAEVSVEVEVIAINDGKNDVVIEGKANKLETYSATPVRLNNAIIKEVCVATPNAEVKVGEGTKVEIVTVTETAKVTSLEVSKDATVTTVYVAGESIRIDGEGRVEKVNVTGNNVIVNTEGTKVIAAENVSGVLAGGIEVKPNQVVTTPVKKPSTGGSSSGGSSFITYTVTFNSNGGTEVASQTVISGHKATEPTAPKKAYSLFKGWYADAECNTPFSFDTDIVANTIVYAKWMTKEECQQAVNKHFANGLNLADLTVDKVYNLSPAFDASITSYTASTQDGVFEFKPKFEVGKSEINIEGLGTYQVTTDIMVSLDENSDGISGNLADGYTIKKAEGTEDKKLTITTQAEVFVDDYGNLGLGYTFVANKVYTITLKTSATSAPYTVTFNSNGGTEVASQTVISGHKATEPTAPKKAYSLFKGWYADAECNTPFSFDTDIVANTTVYAKWMTNEECQQAVNDHFANGLNLADLTVDKVYILSPEFNASTTSYTASTQKGIFEFKPKFEVGNSKINIEGLGTYQVKTDIMVSLNENSDGISGNLADGYTIKKAEGTEDKKLTITTKAEVFVKDYGNLDLGYTFVTEKVYTITLKTSAPYIVTDLTLVNKNNLVFCVRKSDGKYINSSELYNSINGTGTYQVKLPMGAPFRLEAKKADQVTDNDGTWLYINYYDWNNDTFKTVDKVIIEEGTVSGDKYNYTFNVTKSYELMQGETWNTVPVTGISFDKKNIVLALGEKLTSEKQLSTQIKPDLATNKTVIKSSSDTKIITDNSFPQAVGIGDATLIYTTQDGGYTAQCNVKVVHYIIDQTKQVQVPDGTSQNPFASIQAAIGKAMVQRIANPVIYVNNTYSVTEGENLTIPEGVTLTISEGVTLTIPEGVTITVNGTIAGAGSLVVNGTITGDGTWLGKGTN